MISRLIVPRRTSISLAAMTSRCQFIASSACGLSSWKQRAMKVVKSWRSSASYSEQDRSSLIGNWVLAAHPGLQLLDDLLVRRAERALRGFRFCPAFDLLQEGKGDWGGSPFAGGGLIHDLNDRPRAFVVFSPPAVL